MAKKAAPKRRRKAPPTESQAPQRDQSRGLGKHPRRRGYKYSDHGARNTSGPGDDKTIKPSANVRLVRPVFKERDSLIFRPLPCLDDEDESRFMPYRYDMEPDSFTDWIRSYPAAKYIGLGEEAYTFLLYDKTDPNYERRGNPYIILYRAIYNAVKKDFTAPDLSWLRLIDGRQKALPAPTDLFYVQGLVFKQGTDLYVGEGKHPQGMGESDSPQIIQLPRSAGSKLVRACNEVNEKWTGSPGNFEKGMVHGDVVHPKFGRFVRIYPEGDEAAEVDLSGATSWDQASSAGTRPRQGNAGTTGGKDFGGGYGVSLDPMLVIGGKKTQLTPQIPAKIVPMLKRKAVWWDEILHFPTHDELCLMIAKAMRGARSVLEFGWADHPEFFTAEVNEVLLNAKQVVVGAAMPNESDRGADEAAAWANQALVPAEDKRKQRGASVPDAEAEEYGEGEEGYDEYDEEADEYGEEDPAVAATGDEEADDEYGEEYDEEYAEEEEGEEVEGEEVEGEEVEGEEVEGEEGEYDEYDEYDEGDEYAEELPAVAEADTDDDEYGEYDEDSDHADDGVESPADDLGLEGPVSDEEEELMAQAEAAAAKRSAARTTKKARTRQTKKGTKAPPARSAKKGAKKSTKAPPPRSAKKGTKAPPVKTAGKQGPKKGAKRKKKKS